MSDFNIQAWHLRVLSTLVWDVLPPRKWATFWREIGVRAVYEYQRRYDEIRDGEPDFLLYTDSFINAKTIGNQNSKIRDVLRGQGKEIGVIPGQNKIYRAETSEQVQVYYQFRENTMKGMVKGYNGALNVLETHQPDLSNQFSRFDEVPQLPFNLRMPFDSKDN